MVTPCTSSADLTLASAEHGRFKQTDADVGSFDGGFGSAYLARQVGQKFAREIFFLGQEYSAEDGVRMGAVNKAVPHAELEKTGLEWGRLINGKSPTAQRMLKYSFNLIDDGLVGQQLFAGETTRLAYMTDEAQEGRDQFLEKRDPDWSLLPLVLLTRLEVSTSSTGERCGRRTAHGRSVGTLDRWLWRSRDGSMVAPWRHPTSPACGPCSSTAR